jgi:hypothetical protein
MMTVGVMCYLGSARLDPGTPRSTIGVWAHFGPGHSDGTLISGICRWRRVERLRGVDARGLDRGTTSA